MQLENGPLEVLHRVELAVHSRHLADGVTYGVAVLVQPAVLLPVLQKPPAEVITCLLKEPALQRGGVLLRSCANRSPKKRYQQAYDAAHNRSGGCPFPCHTQHA